MHRIQYVSKGMAYALTLAIIMLAVIMAVFTLYPEYPIQQLFSTYSLSPAIPPLSAWQYGALAAVALCSTLPLLFALWKLQKMFLLFAAGEVFSAMATRHLFSAAKAMVIWGMLAIFSTTLAVLILTANAPAGAHVLVVNISSAELAGILGGMIFAVMSWIMQEAARLSEENAGFI